MKTIPKITLTAAVRQVAYFPDMKKNPLAAGFNFGVIQSGNKPNESMQTGFCVGSGWVATHFVQHLIVGKVFQGGKNLYSILRNQSAVGLLKRSIIDAGFFCPDSGVLPGLFSRRGGFVGWVHSKFNGLSHGKQRAKRHCCDGTLRTERSDRSGPCEQGCNTAGCSYCPPESAVSLKNNRGIAKGKNRVVSRHLNIPFCFSAMVPAGFCLAPGLCERVPASQFSYGGLVVLPIVTRECQRIRHDSRERPAPQPVQTSAHVGQAGAVMDTKHTKGPWVAVRAAIAKAPRSAS